MSAFRNLSFDNAFLLRHFASSSMEPRFTILRFATMSSTKLREWKVKWKVEKIRKMQNYHLEWNFSTAFITTNFTRQFWNQFLGSDVDKGLEYSLSSPGWYKYFLGAFQVHVITLPIQGYLGWNKNHILRDDCAINKCLYLPLLFLSGNTALSLTAPCSLL